MGSLGTVVLFDIDGTLINCGGAGRRAMEAAFREEIGRDDVCKFSFGGHTDRAIAREGLANAGLAPREEDIDAILARYLAHLPAQLESGEGYEVFSGVTEILAALAGDARLAVGLGTGNVEEGARHKLRRGGLLEAFGFGGFGCDHESRPRLLEIGAVRGAARLGLERAACRVVIVGDTPRDVHAAHAIGAECLAVRTGWSALEALREAGPARLVDDLRDPEARRFLSALG